MEHAEDTTPQILKSMRLYLRKTQSDVANEAKISLSAYQKFESGERDIRTGAFASVCRILEALNLDATKFYHGDYRLANISCPVEIADTKQKSKYDSKPRRKKNNSF